MGWRGNMYRLAVSKEHRREGIAITLTRTGESTYLVAACVGSRLWSPSRTRWLYVGPQVGASWIYKLTLARCQERRVAVG